MGTTHRCQEGTSQKAPEARAVHDGPAARQEEGP